MGVTKLSLVGHDNDTNLNEGKINNFISQVNVGDELYDIATHHSIVFKTGTSGEAIPWNGVTDIEVVIPTLTDLVQDPVKFAGTIGADGTVKDENNNPVTPGKGDLAYFTSDCAAFKPTPESDPIACEAGDMAIYDGLKWCVVSGENQVEIVGVPEGSNEASVVLTATAKDVLTVEGKHLKLSVDYTGVKDVMTVDKNGKVDLSVKNGTVAVSSKYITLSKANDGSEDISTAVSIDLPTKLSNGDVAISQNVLVASNFVFTSGELPTVSKNNGEISLTVSKTLGISKENASDGASGTYVTSIDGVIKSASIVEANATEADITYVTSIEKVSGTSFVSSAHVKASDESATADFTVFGQAHMDTSTFVSGLSDDAASGDLVSSVSVGAVTFDSSKNYFVTGLTSGTEVVTAVSFGDVVEDTTKSWFATGFGSASVSGEVLSSVSVGAVTLVEDNTYSKDAIVSASVDNHVLSFNTGSFMKPMNVNQVATTMSYKSLNMGGVKLSGQDTTKSGFDTAGFTQAATTISYKSILTGNATLKYDANVDYIFDKKAETDFTPTTAYRKLSTVDATVLKNTPTITGDVTAAIPTDKVVVGFANVGTLPTFTVNDATGTLTGFVNTALTTTSVSWLGINPEKKDITVDGAYTLVETSVSDSAVEVAIADTYTVDTAIVTITSNTFVTNVNVSDTPLVQKD